MDKPPQKKIHGFSLAFSLYFMLTNYLGRRGLKEGEI